jgi:hypothetical protein
LTAEAGRREHTTLPALRKLADARQRQLEKQLAQLDALLDAHVAANAKLAANCDSNRDFGTALARASPAMPKNLSTRYARWPQHEGPLSFAVLCGNGRIA